MVEDYRISARIGTAERTGKYGITKRGTRKEVTRFVERYRTPAGVFLPEEWREKALEAIESAGETELLERIKEHCRECCAWLHREEEIEEYAVDCLCSRAYRHWEDFEADKDGQKSVIQAAE